MVEYKSRSKSVQASGRLDAAFSAMADPTRRAILARLALADARVTEIAGHDVSACRRQPPRGIAVRLAGQRFDAMSLGQQCARNGTSLLASGAGNENASFGGHVSAPFVSHGSKIRTCHIEP